MGQNLPRTEGQIRALSQGLLREKAITHLVDLTAGPESGEEEEVSAANAEEAALAAEEETKDLQEEAQEASEIRSAQEQEEGAEAGRTTTDESSVEKGAEV